MKPIDNDFKRQFTAIFFGSISYVADMHELRNPNDSARRINDAMQQRSVSDADLIALYENCEDPLVTAIQSASRLKEPFNDNNVVISLGDMVANRIDFGEGTDKSIVGKMAKKARELGVSQHVYIADNIEANRKELQEYAHRNNLWTALRFKALDDLLSRNVSLTFAHMNGNADVMSSFVSERVLPGETTPMQTFEASTSIRRYFEKTPGILLLVSRYFDSCGDLDDDSNTVELAKILIPQSLEFDKMGAALEQLNERYLDFLKDPRRFTYEYYRGKIKGESKNNFECTYHPDLLIHEALRPDLCAKAQSVEGMAVYEKALQLWPVEEIIHGHTHNPQFVKYQHLGKQVTQVPPNVLAQWSDITHGKPVLRSYDDKGMLKPFKEM